MLDLLLILLLIILNGVFAMSEIALVSARESRLEPLARQNNAAARTVLRLKEAPNNFLSTVQIGITLIGILAGAVSGRTLADQLTPYLAEIPGLAPYSQTISLAIVVSLVTYLSLVIGELAPKRLALNNPEAISMWIARPMRWLSAVTAPLVRLLSMSTELLLRLLGSTPSEEPPVTEEELKTLLRQGTRAGVFEQTEQEVVGRALDLDDRRVTAVMTPRPDIVWIDLQDPEDVILQTIKESGFSRLPVIDGDSNQVEGIARANELLVRWAEDGVLAVREKLYSPVFVPASASPTQALELIRETRLHTILVVDEYGSVIGLITPTDILEFIVGQLPSLELPQFDEPNILRRDDGSWLVDGMIPLQDLAAKLPENNPFTTIHTQLQTLNGFIMKQLAHIPTTGEIFDWSGYRFEVVDMDGNRVDKVLISLLGQDEETAVDEHPDSEQTA